MLFSQIPTFLKDMPQEAPSVVFADCIERASPSLAAKDIINLISMLIIWRCPCVESSLVLLEEGVTFTSGYFCCIIGEWEKVVSGIYHALTHFSNVFALYPNAKVSSMRF